MQSATKSASVRQQSLLGLGWIHKKHLDELHLLRPGAHVLPHCGPTNHRLRC